MTESSFFTKWERVIKSMALKPWYCDQCQVAVRMIHCPHCGKTEKEER